MHPNSQRHAHRRVFTGFAQFGEICLKPFINLGPPFVISVARNASFNRNPF
jgi:hypothetical protein